MHTQDLSPKKLALLNQLLSAQGIDASVLPITRLNHEGQSAPLSFAQEQLWIAHHLEPESPAYNVHVSLPVRPGLPSGVVERALFEICRRHEVLRTTFPSTSGRPVQVVHEEPRFAFEIRDFQSAEPAEQDRAVAVLQRQVARAPFDLANGPLLRATLARMPDGKQSLLLTMHHIVTDAWSMGVFVREFRELSEAYAAGQPSPLPTLKVQYSDFAAWQRAVLTKARLETGISYWRRQLEGVTALDLPTDRRRPAAPRFEGRIETVTIDARLAEACRELGRRSGATTFTTLLSAFNVLLSLYAAGRRDIVVGVPVAGRDRAEIQPLVGYFVNTLAVRTRLRPGARFNELLRDVQRVVTEAFAHQDVPFDQVTAEVAPDRDFSRHPVFQVLFNLLETTSTARDASAVSSGPMQHASQTTRFDLEAHVVERPGGLDVSFIYNTDVFDAGTVRRMAGHYLALLDAATAGPDQRVDSLARLTAHDRKLVVEEWNRTARDYPEDATIPGLFEVRADLCPHAVAVEWRDQHLDYAALDARANQVAHALQRAGVGTDGRVGVLLDRGLDLIVALLGISKAGAAYLAMDPSDPPARVAGLFVDAGATAMIVAERLAAEPFQQFQQIDMASTAAEPTSRLGLDIPPDALAYVGSTSGSTGRPKGVEVTHRGVVRLLFGSEFMHLGPDETLLSLSPVSFDLSTLEIWGGLLHGGRVVVYPERLPVPSELGELLHARNVTSMWLTSSLYNTVIEQAPWALRGLRQLLIGGEALSVPHIERGLAELSSTTLINGYGPTENTTFTSCYRIPRRLPPESTSIPIGPPIANTTAFVLDPSGEPLPIGVPGELCTGGDGLARGYASAPRLTAERFIPDAVSGTSGGRLYKTGDLARWRDDGTLEFLGRRDGQIKLRGFRIELGELEAALSALPGVSSCAAAVHETADGKRLVAYVVPSNGSIDTAELRRALQDRLPAFMVPASIVSLEALPLTPSGKTDRRALPRPELPAAEDRGVEAPRTPTEETLARIFAEVFRRPHVGVHDDFLSLGGDSILSIQIASRAGDTGLKVKPRQLFEYPTVAELAAVVGAHAAPAPEAAPPSAASAVSSAAPLTPIQHWFLDSDPIAPHHFNQALMLQVRDGVDAGVLERAVDYLTHQHEALCSRFQRIEGDWERHVGGPLAESPFTAVDLQGIPEADRAAALTAHAASVQTGFDIQTGPVFRAVLFDLGNTTPRRLLLSAHHLVIDGVSWRILLDDLAFAVSELTDGRVPAPRRKTTAVHDWAAILVEQANRHGLDPSFWIAQAGRARALGVSGGAADSRLTAGEAAPISCSIGREQTALVLREIPRAFGATIEEVLLAALARAFAACGHGSALFLDLERHGRSDAFDDVDLSRTVGWLTTIFPLLLDTGSGTIETIVESVRQRVRAVPNDGVDWGLLRYLAASRIRRQLKALDEPRISFNYLGQFDQLSSGDGVFTLAAEAVGPLRSPAAPCRYALEIVAAVRNGQLRLDWIIGSASYPRPTIERLAAAFGAVIDEMTRFAGRPRGADEAGPATDRLVADSALAAVRSFYDDVDDVYPLTAMQQAMLFHSLLHPEEALYTELVTLRIEGPLNADALREAWRVVVNRHEALRCVFAWEGMPVPVQVVRHRLDPEWVVRDESGTDARGEQDRLQAVVASEQHRSFDFARGPLMRFALVRVSTVRAHLVWTFHHALLDGWSVGLVLRQVQEAYQALVDGTPVSEATSPARHRGYVEWLQAQPTDGAKAYWKALLHDVTAPTPVGIVRSVDHGSAAPDPADRTVHLDPAVVERLRGAARSLRVTPNTVLTAAWALVLSRYSDRDDVVFGTTVSGRPPTVPGVESMVGLFINTVPVRVVVPTAGSAAAWLKSVHDAQLDQREHEYLPLVEITQCSAVARGTGLFDTMFVFENYPTLAAADDPSASARTRISADSRHRSNYPLVLVATLGERLVLRALYDRRRVDDEAVTRLLRHMTNALIELIDRPHRAVGDLRLVTDVEQTALVGQGRGERSGYPAASLGALFAAQVAARREAVALECGATRLTYGALDAWANQVAQALRRAGVGLESRVGVVLPRGVEQIVAVLGVVKAGGAYVALEETDPAARVAQQLTDAGAAVVVTRGGVAAGVGAGRRVIAMETVAAEPADDPQLAVPLDALAYVAFTSGSTGRPKGVEVRHRGVVRLLYGQQYVRLGPEETLLQLAPVSFDASTLEIWGALLHGGRLVIYPERVPEPAALGAELRRTGVTTAWLTASLYNTVITQAPAALGGLRQLLIGGEALSVPHVRAGLAALPATTLINGYGPTESTTFTCCYPIPRPGGGETAIPLGGPIAHTDVYVLDAAGRLAPPGVAGELYIGGDGLARGYAGAARLTAAKFVPDGVSGARGARLYRTGDTVRWAADGTLAFLGRRDGQIKLRGYRIELGEVTAALQTVPGVATAAAAVHGTGDGRQLVGYVVAAGDTRLEPARVRAALQAHLPGYLVPAAVVVLDALPLTATGKVDRDALPPPDAASVTASPDYVEPRSDTESAIAAIWSRLLGAPRVGRDDDFFELGGHSLLAVQALGRLRQTFSIELPLAVLFGCSTVAELAAEIDRRLARHEPPVESELVLLARDQQLPLSHAQERLWFLDQLEPGSAAYNVPITLALEGALDAVALERAFTEIVRRHEVLRTTFADDEGRPFQVVREAAFRLDRVDLRALDSVRRQSELEALARADALAPFDLRRGPLMRACLVRLDDAEHALLLNLHHVVCDAWSLRVLVRELATLYDAFCDGRAPELPPVALHYSDFAVWQRKWLTGPERRRQLDYWVAQLADTPTLELPRDRPRPAAPTYNGAHHAFTIPGPLSDGIKALARREGATLFTTMLALFKALLFRYTGQSDIVVGTPIAYRPRPELEPLIGFFSNSLALRTHVDPNGAFPELLRAVRDVTVDAFANQDVPFELVVDAVQPERHLDRNPLFQTLFTLQHAAPDAAALRGLTMKPIEVEGRSVRLDMEFHIGESAEGLIGAIYYSTDLFDAATIARFASHFTRLLQSVVEEPERPVAELTLIPADERTQIQAWNATAAPLRRELTIIEWFEEQVARTPHHVAVEFHGLQLTYEELNAKANQLARCLKEYGVRPDDRAAICVDRSIALAVCVLGALKAGAAYVPLDPSYPADRLQYMLGDSGAKVVVMHEHLLPLLSPKGRRRRRATKRAPAAAPPTVLCIDRDWDVIARHDDHDLARTCGPHHLAYVLYTSGSTGRPKGVAMPHRALVNLAEWQLGASQERAAGRTLQYAPLSFDPSFLEMFSTWFAGGTVVLIEEALRRDFVALLRFLDRHAIERLYITPAALHQLADVAETWRIYPRALREVNAAGERLEITPAVARFFRALGDCTLFNQYGPTESHVVTASMLDERTSPWPSSPSIGCPLPNTQVHLLDGRGGSVPIGVPGELFIAGECLARGYLDKPRLTAERFVPDPSPSAKGGRLYRSGDLARRRHDGSIEFLGRTDHQVKLRGYRVEPGEIEAVLTEHRSVLHAAVAVPETAGKSRQLVAYVVARDGHHVSAEQLRAHMARRVPDYMVPSIVEQLETLPLTPSGKVDRAALPEPTGAGSGDGYLPPRTDVEHRLAALWSEILEVERVGIADNFFSIGGHSLSAVQVVSRVRREWGVEIPIRTLFECPTVSGLAERLEDLLWMARPRDRQPAGAEREEGVL